MDTDINTCRRAKAAHKPLSKRFSEQEIFEVMDKYYGNKSLIVAALDCSPQQLEVWMRKPVERKQHLLAAREKVLDKAEEKMLQLLDSNDPRIVLDTSKFILQHLGRHRGYYGDSPAIQIQAAGNDLKLQIQQLFQ